MKKLLIYGYVLAMCVATGCKKDYQNTKIYLLQQQITDDREDGLPIDTATYSYDDHDRVIMITDGTVPNKQTITIAYDSQNRVTSGKKYGGNGNLEIQYDFFYRGDTTGYIFHLGAVADTAYFTFNSKNQVTLIKSLHSGYETFAYDTRGNVSATQGYANDGSYNLNDQGGYTYDNMKNPFSETLHNNLFLEYIVFIDNPSTLINNVLDKDGEPFTYSYNKDGFPVNATIATYANSTIKVYFSYIVK